MLVKVWIGTEVTELGPDAVSRVSRYLMQKRMIIYTTYLFFPSHCEGDTWWEAILAMVPVHVDLNHIYYLTVIPSRYLETFWAPLWPISFTLEKVFLSKTPMHGSCHDVVPLRSPAKVDKCITFVTEFVLNSTKGSKGKKWRTVCGCMKIIFLTIPHRLPQASNTTSWRSNQKMEESKDSDFWNWLPSLMPHTQLKDLDFDKGMVIPFHIISLGFLLAVRPGHRGTNGTIVWSGIGVRTGESTKMMNYSTFTLPFPCLPILFP